MQSNPFDAQNDAYLVVVNAEGQHSLWPDLMDVPAGWEVAHGPADRAACLEYVTVHWTDLRPRSVAVFLDRCA